MPCLSSERAVLLLSGLRRALLRSPPRPQAGGLLRERDSAAEPGDLEQGQAQSCELLVGRRGQVLKSL